MLFICHKYKNPDKNTSNVSLEIQVLISKQLKMPDWEQLTTVGVDQAWRVVRKEVVLSIIHIYDKTSIIVCVNIFFHRWRRSCFLDFCLCHVCFKLTTMT